MPTSPAFPGIQGGRIRWHHPAGYRLKGGTGGNRNTTVYEIQVQGLNTLIEHWGAVAEATRILTPMVVENVAGLMAGRMKNNHLSPLQTSPYTGRPVPLPRSGETLQSISATPVRYVNGGWTSDIGPETLQARMQEFGFYHHGLRAVVGPYPFVIPAADAYEPVFVDAMDQIARIADQLRGAVMTEDGGALPEIHGFLQSIRGRLYSTAKALGDVQAFVGVSGGIGATRTGLYGMARVLGDISSVMRGTIGQRVEQRFAGHFTGLGFSASYTASVSTVAGGAAGQRIYNRVAGRFSRRQLLGRL